MLMLAKLALGLSATAAMAAGYILHEGVIRVAVDEHRVDGSHLHLWVPATFVSTGLHFVPNDKMRQTAQQVRPYLPLLREVSKELAKFPDAELVDVQGGQDHVRGAMVRGKLQIDAVSSDGDVVHISVPARVLRDVADELEAKAPGV